MRLRRAAGGQPAATFLGEDQRSAFLADEGEAVGIVDRSRPEREVESAEPLGAVADEAELRESDDLLGAELAVPVVLLEAVVRDQLDDVPCGIEEVDGACVPVLELKDASAEKLELVLSP